MSPAQFRRHLADPRVSGYARWIDPECPLDRWIAYAVKVLRDSGVETYESCQGGSGHSFREPIVRFHGGTAEGYRAAAIAMQNGLPVVAVRRFWRVIDGELEGPNWEMTFGSLAALRKLQMFAETHGFLQLESGPERLGAAQGAGEPIRR